MPLGYPFSPGRNGQGEELKTGKVKGFNQREIESGKIVKIVFS
jgi:hypothetical protein